MNRVKRTGGGGDAKKWKNEMLAMMSGVERKGARMMRWSERTKLKWVVERREECKWWGEKERGVCERRKEVCEGSVVGTMFCTSTGVVRRGTKSKPVDENLMCSERVPFGRRSSLYADLLEGGTTF